MFCTSCAADNARRAAHCIVCGQPLASSAGQLSRTLPANTPRPSRASSRLLMVFPLAILIGSLGFAGGQVLSSRASRAEAYHDAERSLAAGDLVDAQRGFAELGDYRDAESRLTAIAAAIAPYESQVEAARALGAEGRYAEAITQLLRVVRDLPSYDDATELLADLRQQYHDDLLDEATRAERDSDWYRVERSLRELLRDDPTNSTFAIRLATVQQQHAAILYAREGVVYLADPSGGDEHAITPTMGATWPIWSPTRDRVAFVQRDPQRNVFDGTLFVVDRDGSNLHALAERVVPFYWPIWSPDGQRIAFASAVNFDESRDEGTIELHVVDLVTRTETDLTGGRLPHAYSPSWSPDGSTIAFVSYRLERRRNGGVRSTDGEVYTINLATRELTDVSLGRIEDEALLAWSPVDDRLMIFTIPDDWNNPRQSQILLLDLQTTEITEVPTHAWQLAFPVWSPDGQKIAYVEGDNVVRIWSEGHDDWVMVETKLSPYISWSDDGSLVLAAAEKPGTPSYILPVGEQFGARTAIELMFNGADTSGPPAWSPMTVAPKPASQSVGGTAFDRD